MYVAISGMNRSKASECAYYSTLGNACLGAEPRAMTDNTYSASAFRASCSIEIAGKRDAYIDASLNERLGIVLKSPILTGPSPLCKAGSAFG